MLPPSKSSYIVDRCREQIELHAMTHVPDFPRIYLLFFTDTLWIRMTTLPNEYLYMSQTKRQTHGNKMHANQGYVSFLVIDIQRIKYSTCGICI